MLLSLLVGLFDQQNVVFGHYPYQGDEADLGVYVEHVEPEIEWHDGSEDRKRH